MDSAAQNDAETRPSEKTSETSKTEEPEATRKSVECSVCLQEYTRGKRCPVALMCGHSFCLVCVKQVGEKTTDDSIIRSWISHDEFGAPLEMPILGKILVKRAQYVVVCPLCKTKTRYPTEKELHKNYVLVELLEKLGELGEDVAPVVVQFPVFRECGHIEFP